MMRRLLILLAASGLSACSLMPGGSGGQPQQPRRSQSSLPANPGARQCLAQLGSAGARFTPLPDRYISTGCTNLNTVQITALQGDGSNIAIGNIGPATCGVSQAFAGWVRFGADRAARQILGSPLRSVETFGSYSCRNVAGTNRRSAHSTADAIDISAFVLQDGRRVSVKGGWNDGSSAERRFLRVVHDSACKRFDTVLGPEYNAAHHDHLHVEGVISGSSYCR